MFRRAERKIDEAIRVTAGHWTDPDAMTGCTVIIFDRPAPAVADVRGGAPGTRETDVLGPGRLVREVDAILLTGGSAFGLAAADGVMQVLRERKRGVQTPAGPVPIVPTAVIYDLGVGQAIAPDATAGRQACLAAAPVEQLQRGRIGIGVGATSAKLYAPGGLRGGFGIGRVDWSAGSVCALAAVNAAGAVVHPDSGRAILADGEDVRETLLDKSIDTGERQATTLGVVLVGAPVDETALIRCAVAAHDAIARAVRPSHTIFDGDVVFAVGLLQGSPAPTQVLSVSTATELAMERAIVDAVTA